MAVGSIVHPTVGTLGFLVMSTPEGWPIDQSSTDEEELRSPGVDGLRWRTTSYQHAPVVMTTLADDTSYATLIGLARKYRKCKNGLPVTVAVTIAGVNYTFKNVHVIDVQPRVSPGGCYGAGAASGSAAHIEAVWSLILMNTAATGE